MNKDENFFDIRTKIILMNRIQENKAQSKFRYLCCLKNLPLKSNKTKKSLCLSMKLNFCCFRKKITIKACGCITDRPIYFLNVFIYI